MKKVGLIIILFIFCLKPIYPQDPQGFFIDDWQAKNVTVPDYITVNKSALPINVSIKVNYNDVITKVPTYVFGDNANLWTGSMAENKTLMKNIANRKMGALRGPGGSTSDIFFWNRKLGNRPTDIPDKLAGATTTFTPWYGKYANSWDNWTMDVDSFYSILKQTNSTGMITVNYGYARYGTSQNPVAQAAHLAADWVRYDKGRSKFWEIGNEVSGSWEAGYRIDQSLNKDGQPEFINGTLYGQHCLVFIDSMKKAASEIGVTIKIGAVVAESNGSNAGDWNNKLFSVVGDKIDFYIVHSYYTPYNSNSNASVILNSPSLTSTYKDFVNNGLTSLGKPLKPIALTEYNIFATGSKQAVSFVNGLHGVMVTGEVIKNKFGSAFRWDLANGWSNGDDHGMFSYGSEPGVNKYSPRPAFYTLYYMQRFMGDMLLNYTLKGDPNLVVYTSKFSSGHIGAVFVNKGNIQKVVRFNIENTKVGDRYYFYTLEGGTDNGEFSGQVYVNGTGPAGVAGGPANYETIKARSCPIDGEIIIEVPGISAVYLLVEPGQNTLPVNEILTSVNQFDDNSQIQIYPSPSHGKFFITNIPAEIQKIEIINLSGQIIFSLKDVKKSTVEIDIEKSLDKGIYFIHLSGIKNKFSKKLIIE